MEREFVEECVRKALTRYCGLLTYDDVEAIVDEVMEEMTERRKK